ncbi:MAG: DUF935 domain-containing protein, partial [Gemmatimonadota bacterium]|nr:DUF935 domain-containing protein [Gemmatimonadota bacterium]
MSKKNRKTPSGPTNLAAPGQKQVDHKVSTAKIFKESVVDEMMDFFGQVQDPDTILQKAGLTRADLRAMEGDDEISGAMDTRREAVLITPWRLEPGEGQLSKFLIEELESIIEPLLRCAHAAVPYGYSVGEVVYRRRPDDLIGIGAVIEKPFEWFRPDRQGNLYYYPRTSVAGLAGILVNTRTKFLLTRRNPTHLQPYGDSLYSKLYWPFFFRQNGWRFWMQFLERHGTPLLVGKGSDPQRLAESLAAAVQDAVIGVQTTDSVESIATTKTGGEFEKLEQALIKRINKRILGQTLTSDVGDSGSYA